MSSDFIDIAESVASKMDMDCSRSDNEFIVKLKNGKFVLSVFVRSDYDIMHFSCNLRLKVPKTKRDAILRAIAQVNERIWIGHFDFLSIDSSIVYSLTIPFMSSFVVDSSLVSSIYQTITSECDKFYDYFSILINSRKKTNEDCSISALFIDTYAEA